MKIEYHEHYSGWLNRTMKFKVYGHGGKPVLFIPCQGGRFFDFENFHMIDYWAKWIEDGKVMVFSIDTIDLETWSDKNGDPAHRSYMHEQIEYAVRADVHRYPRFNWNAIAKWGNGDDGEALFTAVTSFCAYQDIIKDEKIQEAVKESAASQIATEICKKLRNKNIYAKVCEFLVDQMGKEETNG